MSIKLRLCLIIIFASISCLKLSAANMKPYIDWDNGYSGYANADYVGTTRTINPSQFAEEGERRIRAFGATITRYCQKLSKSENFLLWSALNEYNYSDNEIYSVTIQQGMQILQLIVVIRENGNSVDWYGGWYIADR